MDAKTLEERLAKLEGYVALLIKENRYPNKDCFTYAELAEMAGVSVATIRAEEKKGMIRVRYPNAKKRFHQNDVDAYLRGRKG